MVGPEGRLNGPIRVLLAEDNSTNQRLAKRLLEKLGCRVDLAADGREATDLAKRLPYDVIFMDCQMPELDGPGATVEIRRWEAASVGSRAGAGVGAGAGHSSASRIPIIAVTAAVLDSDRARCMEAGMDDFIAKPLSIDDLSSALEKWCRVSAQQP